MSAVAVLGILGIGILLPTISLGEGAMTYAVRKSAAAPKIDAVWDKDPWRTIAPLRLENAMGEPPSHRPVVQAKIAYDGEAVYVIFRVEDRYVRAVADGYQGRVWEDSCVEFFFTPGPRPDDGYFNLEMNCGGTALFHHQKERGKDVVPVSAEDFAKIQVAHSLPKIVDPEIEGPVTWTVEYRLPIAILGQYAAAVPPAPGAAWRANFYKCGDKTSHPHWLTWAPVDFPKPNFHLPAFFGALIFE